MGVFPKRGNSFAFCRSGNGSGCCTGRCTHAQVCARQGRGRLAMAMNPHRNGCHGVPASHRFGVGILNSTVPRAVAVGNGRTRCRCVNSRLTLLVAVPRATYSRRGAVMVRCPASVPRLGSNVISRFGQFDGTVATLGCQSTKVMLAPTVKTARTADVTLACSPRHFGRLVRAFGEGCDRVPRVLGRRGLGRTGDR